MILLRSEPGDDLAVLSGDSQRAPGRWIHVQQSAVRIGDHHAITHAVEDGLENPGLLCLVFARLAHPPFQALALHNLRQQAGHQAEQDGADKAVPEGN